MDSEATPSPRPSATVWTGRILSILLALFLIVSGVFKLQPVNADTQTALDAIGIPTSMLVALAAVEIVSAILFVIPQTAVVGAILLTGYMGGAICTHWRVGDSFVVQIIIPVLVWVAMALREPRLWSLIPLRKLT
jgi:uncharacterized membrane protein YphA (DoxX/SURF4 family)